MNTLVGTLSLANYAHCGNFWALPLVANANDPSPIILLGGSVVQMAIEMDPFPQFSYNSEAYLLQGVGSIA
jgi:hypothetical protein